MDFEQFKTSVDNMYMNKNLDINSSIFKQILSFLDDNKEIKEILGHQQNLFFLNEKDYFKDYFLKRTLIGSAIDEQKKQILGLQLSKLMIDKYHDKLDFNKLFVFIKKNVSFQAALNKTEKKYFVYSYLFLSCLFLKYIDDNELINNMNIEIIKLLNKNNLFKIQFTEIIAELKIDLNKIQNILEFCLNQNLNTNYETFILSSQMYLLYHTSMKNQFQKSLNNKIQQGLKLKTLQKYFDEIFEDQNLKNKEKQSIIFKVLGMILCQMQHLDLLIHIFNIQKEKAHKIKNKQRLFSNIIFIVLNLLKIENFKLREYCQNDLQLFDIFGIVFYLFEENLIKRIKGLSQLEVIQSVENMLTCLSQVQNFQLAQKIITSKKFIQIPNNLKQKILNQLQDNELVNLVKILLEKKKQNYQKQNYQNYKQCIHNILNFLNYVKSEQVFQIVITKIFKIYLNAKKIIKNFPDLLQDQSLNKSTLEFQTFIYNHLSETLFQIKNFELLKSCIQQWTQILKVEDMKEFFNLAEKTKKKQENLACLLVCLGFQNYETEEKDYQSVIFNQSFQDFQIFCGNLCEEDQLESSDYEILVDCIISLMAVQNKNLRNLILDVFKNFVTKFDINILNSIESELFRPLKSSLYNPDQEQELDDELEFDEDQEDIVIG